MKTALSDREREIVMCAAMGMGCIETGRHLGLVPATVKSHRQRILTKWDAKQKGGMAYIVSLAYRRGILVPAVNPNPFAVSPSRMRVLIGVAKGWSNKRIATELIVTEDTIKTHVRALNKQLGTNNRTHLVAMAFHTGTLVLIPPGSDRNP